MWDAAVIGNRAAIEVVMGEVASLLEKTSLDVWGAVQSRIDGDDVRQTALLNAYASLTQGDWVGRSRAEFDRWVCSHAFNCRVSLVRGARRSKRAAHRTTGLSYEDGSAVDVASNAERPDLIAERNEELLLASELFDEVLASKKNAVARELTKAVVDLLKEGFNCREIADRFGWKVERVNAIKRRFFQSVREMASA